MQEPLEDSFATAGVLEEEVIEALHDLDDDDLGSFLIELVDNFISDSPLRMAALADGLAGNDCVGVVRAAHAFKSNAGNLGATRLCTLCQRVEDAARVGRTDGMERALREIECEFRAVVEKLRAALPEDVA